MQSVTWNKSETVRGSESEEATVRGCFFFFIFSEGRTYSPLARRASGGTLLRRVVRSSRKRCFLRRGRQCRKPSLPEQQRIVVQFSLHETLHRRVSGYAVETVRRFKKPNHRKEIFSWQFTI